MSYFDTIFIKLAEVYTYFMANMSLTMVGKVFSLLLIVWMVQASIKAHRDPHSFVDLNDILVDSSGKIGGSQMRLNLAYFVSTWILVYATLNGALSEWLFAAYLAAFVYDRSQSRNSSPLPIVPPESECEEPKEPKDSP